MARRSDLCDQGARECVSTVAQGPLETPAGDWQSKWKLTRVTLCSSWARPSVNSIALGFGAWCRWGWPGGLFEALQYRLDRNKLAPSQTRRGPLLAADQSGGHTPEEIPALLHATGTRWREPFPTLKGRLGDPNRVYHQSGGAHREYFRHVSWPTALQVTLAQRLKGGAPGWTPRSALEQLKAMQLIDVKVPTADGRWLEMARYTQPDKAQQLTLAMLKLELPAQPPRKSPPEAWPTKAVVVKTFVPAEAFYWLFPLPTLPVAKVGLTRASRSAARGGLSIPHRSGCRNSGSVACGIRIRFAADLDVMSADQMRAAACKWDARSRDAAGVSWITGWMKYWIDR